MVIFFDLMLKGCNSTSLSSVLFARWLLVSVSYHKSYGVVPCIQVVNMFGEGML